MPYIHEWVEPELAFTVNEIDVYHTYIDEMWDHPYTNWYTTVSDGWDKGDCDDHFDIREIKKLIDNERTCELQNLDNHQKILETFFNLDWRKYNLSCFQHLE